MSPHIVLRQFNYSTDFVTPVMWPGAYLNVEAREYIGLSMAI